MSGFEVKKPEIRCGRSLPVLDTGASSIFTEHSEHSDATSAFSASAAAMFVSKPCVMTAPMFIDSSSLWARM